MLFVQNWIGMDDVPTCDLEKIDGLGGTHNQSAFICRKGQVGNGSVCSKERFL